jgi:hypothetical protein
VLPPKLFHSKSETLFNCLLILMQSQHAHRESPWIDTSSRARARHELVRLSRTSIADEMREEHRRQALSD